MTVNISKPALNLREELAALRNQGGAYEESKFYLDSLVTNGTFDTDISGWVDGNTEGTIAWNASGYMDMARNSGSGSNVAKQALTGLIVGQTYKVSWNAIAVSHSHYARCGGANLSVPANGTTGLFSFDFIATTTTATLEFMLSNSSTATATIDNVSVYETDGTNLIHSTPHGYSIKDVYIDGELAREGSAYDYTVHDGYIKPTVAPTATTETCLIGVRT